MTYEEQPISAVEVKDLLGKVSELHASGYRFVQACCTKIDGNNFEILYSFDKDLKFTNLRITFDKDAEIPSITGIYKGTFLYENEMNELFGIRITGINVDFKGTLYKKKVQSPFSVEPTKGGDACQKK
jgi:ech hydrogenase subunit D